jgi:broad specificity phosphatase PhoE
MTRNALEPSTQPKTLILIKHARPLVIPDMPAPRWTLSAAGRAACEPLARALASWRLDVLLASEEPKATETALLTAERLGVPWRTAPGLHEHDREGAPFFADEAAFAAAVETLFAQPDARVYGRETASEALRRFSTALDAALTDHAGRSVAVVAHGTVIALYVASQWGLSACAGFDLWRRLGLPSMAVTRAPGLTAPLVIEWVG